MPLSTEGFKEKVKDIVRVHYEKSSAPLMLAHLGAVIEREDAWPEDRGERSLKRLLKDLLYPELDVVWDEGSPAFIAVVTPALRSTVQAQIERRHIERRHHDVATTSVQLEDIAHPVLLAFCIRVPPENPVYVRRLRPFRYELQAPESRVAGEYLIVEPEYRRPGLRVNRLDQLERSDRMDLIDRIMRWAEAHGVRIEEFSRSDREDVQGPKAALTALDRLVAAQPPEIVGRLLIPGDIAQILARRR